MHQIVYLVICRVFPLSDWFILVFHLNYDLLLFISVYKFNTLNDIQIILSAQLILK